MVDIVYIEESISTHARVQRIHSRFPKAQRVFCQHYSEIFNRKAQNFRLQKNAPSLILAEKQGNRVLEAPPEYGIGGDKNYYFSHMLNCPYDCRYCFLQGMYQSANYVLFINYEDFLEDIDRLLNKHPQSQCHFFSGYDGDSLAYDPVSGFTETFLPFFKQRPQALLELRTKSTQIRSLLAMKALPNCIVAFSFTPQALSFLEKGVPSVSKRIAAMQRLQKAGWILGLRFDPLIYHENYQKNYRDLFAEIFNAIDISAIHSVSMGVFRLPDTFFQKIARLYPDEAFFSGPMALSSDKKMTAYPPHLEQMMTTFCETELLQYISPQQYFPCTLPTQI